MNENQIQQLEKAAVEINTRRSSCRKRMWAGTLIGIIAYIFALSTINDGKGEGGFLTLPIIILVSYGHF